MGAALSFEIGFSEIFADNTKEEKLDATDEHDDTDKARPAGSRVAEGNSFDDDDDDNYEGDEAKEDAKESGEGERDGRESDNTLDGIFEEFPEGPFCFAGDALDVFVFDPFGFEANKGPETFRVAAVFLAGEDGIDNLAGHEAVVAGAVDHFDFVHAVDKFVEDAGAEAANGRFTFAGNATGGGYIVFFFGGFGGVDVLKKFGEETGWILTVGVHGGNKITGGVFEAGEESGFFAEVAGEGNVEDARVVFGEGFYNLEGVVAATVIDEDEFELIVMESVDGFEGFLIKEGERGGFVVTGDDNADSFHTLIIA